MPGAAEFDGLLARARALAGRTACGRFAPSPSGDLHLGNVRTALLAWLQARLGGARFVLRMEDLDRPRERPGSAERIVADLRWLGLDWDEGPDGAGTVGPYRQSQRQALYGVALERLRRAAAVYPCACSRADIQAAASAPQGPLGPLYPGTCREREPAAVHRAAAERRREAAWRFHAPDGEVHFDDRIAGAVTQNLRREAGDFVLRRSDGLFAYQLAVAVDDALMGVTDVVRGADLLESTPRQIALLRALGLPAPRYWHVPLMCDAAGKRMAKRDGSDSVAAYRAGGGSAGRLVGKLAASLGLVPPATELTAGELLAALDETTLVDALRGRSRAAGSPTGTPLSG